MYEIYCKLRDLNGMKDAAIATATGIPKSTFPDWKNGRSNPKDAKLSKLADFFGVTTDFLTGKTDTVICPICHQKYEPLNPAQFADHKAYHEKYVSAQLEYGDFSTYSEANRKRTECIETFRNKNRSDDDRISAFEKYLDADFTVRIYQAKMAPGLDRDEIARSEIESLHPDYVLSESLINRIRELHDMPGLPSEGATYYYDSDVREIADFLSRSPEYKTLFDAARKVKPDDIRFVKEMIERMSDKD